MRLSGRGYGIALAILLLALGGYVAYYVVAAGVGRDAGDRAIAPPFGTAEAGAEAIRAYGCHACHEIAGVRAPGGRVGPSLVDLPSRRFLAGERPNTPTNLVAWIMAPQAIRPGSAMPNLGVTREDAEDIAAYLYVAGARR